MSDSAPSAAPPARRNRLATTPPAPPGDDAVANGRLFNVLDTARLLNRNRQTLLGWIDDGAPVHSRNGQNLMLDLAAVVVWRETWARQKAERRNGATIPNPDDPEAPKMTIKEQIAWDKLDMQKMDKAAKAGLLVGRPAAEAVFERALGIVRQSVMGVPERIVREMAGFPEAKKLEWRGKAQEHCRSALAEAAKDVAKLLPGLRKGGK